MQRSFSKSGLFWSISGLYGLHIYHAWLGVGSKEEAAAVKLELVRVCSHVSG